MPEGHQRPNRAITPNDVGADSLAKAVAHVRALRRVMVSGDAWLVRDTWDTYDHRVVMRRIGDGDLEFICIAYECRATRAAPCWAVAKVRASRSARHLTAVIRATHKGDHP